VWRLIQGTVLWVQVVRAKYIATDTMENWVRNPFKQSNNASIIWKALTYAFHLVRNWLIWKISKGDKVQISLDPWVGSKAMHQLPFPMIQEL
jgi:hypothetical protein